MSGWGSCVCVICCDSRVSGGGVFVICGDSGVICGSVPVIWGELEVGMRCITWRRMGVWAVRGRGEGSGTRSVCAWCGV